MSADFSASITPVLSPDLLSGGLSAAGLKGSSQPDKIKAVCKAMEGLFAGQLLSEMGKGLGGPNATQDGGLYQDFIQQAMAQQVTSGGGFGLASMLEKCLTPAQPHPAGAALHPPTSPSHADGITL